MKCKPAHNAIVVRQEEIHALYNHAHGIIWLWKNADETRRNREIKWNQAAFTIFLILHLMQRSHQKIHQFKKETRVGKVYQRGIFIAHSTTRSRKEKTPSCPTTLKFIYWKKKLEFWRDKKKRFQNSCSKNRTGWTREYDTTQQAVNYFRLWIHSGIYSSSLFLLLGREESKHLASVLQIAM